MKSNFSYITQMTGTTKFLYKNCSHSQKRKIRIIERPSPSNSPEIVLHAFRHSTLIVPWFQEDLGFWSAEQLEPDKSMLKIRGKHKSQSWGKANSRRPLPPLTLKIRTCEEFRSFTLWHCHIALLPSRLPSPRDYKWVIVEYPINWSFCYFQVFLLHTQKKR